jgi:hypothetical protein
MARKRIHFWLAVVAALVMAGCGGGTLVAADDGATGPCANAAPAGQPSSLTCQRAIEVADARLGWLHLPVSSVEYRTDVCPPNARCRFDADSAWILYTFMNGDRTMIHVARVLVGDEPIGDFAAGEPEPLPDWLLDEAGADVGG